MLMMSSQLQAYGVSAKPPSHGNRAELWRASLVRTGLLGPLRVASQGFADTP